jgi:hypothetical protein
VLPLRASEQSAIALSVIVRRAASGLGDGGGFQRRSMDATRLTWDESLCETCLAFATRPTTPQGTLDP